MPDVEEMQGVGTERKGIDGRMDGWILVKAAGKGGCNGGERRAGKAK